MDSSRDPARPGTNRRRIRATLAVSVLVAAVTILAGPAPEAAADHCAGPPTLIGPQGVRFNPRPLFRWNPVEGIDEYVLLILYASPDEEYVIPGQPFHIDGATSFRPPEDLPFDTEMRWKVKTECENEHYSGFSPDMYFTLQERCPPIC
jgi:hypothetical protein